MQAARVWTRFQRTLKDGSVKNFKIQFLPSEMEERAVAFMKPHFMAEEPYSISAGFAKNSAAVESMNNIWRKFSMPQKLTIVCLEDNDDDDDRKKDIIAVNFLTKSIRDSPMKIPEEPREFFRVYKIVESKCNIYKMFDVDKYLSAFGLAVNNKYRGLGIGFEMLLARTPICKDLDYKLTVSQFTTPYSQKAAEKAGFTTILDVPASEFMFVDNKKLVFPSIFKSVKLMIKEIL